MQVGSTVIAIVMGSFVLAGCQTKGIYSNIHQAKIVDVRVVNRANNLPPRITPALEQQLNRRFAAIPSQGRPKCLTVTVDTFHLKNPAMALLVGDANKLQGSLVSADLEGRRVDAQKPVLALSDVAINGVLGAVHAAMQENEKVAAELAGEFERSVISTVYGSAVSNQAMKSRMAPSPEITGSIAAVPSSSPAAAAPQVTTSLSPCRPTS